MVGILPASRPLRSARSAARRFPEFYPGGVLSRPVPVNSGADDKALREAQVAEKFRASASLAMDEGQAARVLDLVMRLESVPVPELTAALRIGD